MASLTVACGSNRGQIQSFNSVYSTARSGGTLDKTSTLVLGQTPSYYCVEAFLDFDTSGLPDNAVISNCDLVINIIDDKSLTDFTIKAALRDYDSTLTTADWVAGASLGALTLLASKSTSGIATNQYVSLTPESAFVSNVSLTASTRIILFSSRHEGNNTPTGHEYVEIDSTTYVPQLTLTYTAAIISGGTQMMV